ncbi:LacI family DNA-binding transcriptional regulator [Nocardia sp. NBC_01377]|uniref:LacI family DNA-binding transcriptional regulator n=1 Tax=Nocardia sp. NBC_01377 TaxID=2903595 RepID=UPI003863138D
MTGSDVALAAGVSRTTVSFVLNNRPGQSIPDQTRRRVVEAASRLGYRPRAAARALAAGRSDIVLLSVPDLPLGAAITRFVEELAAALAAHGLTLVAHLAATHGGGSLSEVCASVDASVVIGLTPFPQRVVEELHRSGADVVIPTDKQQGATFPTEQIGRVQADYLIAKGHRRIGYALPDRPELLDMAEERLRGAVDACADAGLDAPITHAITLNPAEAARAVQRWRTRSVTGICAYNDEIAVAVLAGVHATGLTAPSDIAVIGADDIPTAAVSIPALTTVAFDLREVGVKRAEAVVAILSGAAQHAPLIPITPQVVERSSV